MRENRIHNLPYEKVGKNEPVCIADEVPFEIPESWEWARLKDLTIKEIKRGKSPKYADDGNVYVFAQKCNVKLGGIDVSLAKFLDMKTFDKYPVEEYMADGDIIINSTGNGTLGRIGIFRDSDRINDFVIVPDSHVTIIRIGNQMIKDYLFFALKYYQPYLEKVGEGSTNQTELRPSTVAELFIPIPPIKEQERIVKKLLEVIPMVDMYGKKEKLLQTYNIDFPTQLKKSILQEAVQGKLVPQDENDEPASVLLERIKVEKEALIKAGKIKKDKHESVIFRRDNSHYEKLDGIERCIDDEIPFDIPDTWEWIRMGALFTINPRNAISDDTVVGFMPMPLLQDGFSNSHTFEERQWKDIKSGFTHFADNDVVIAKITPCFQNRKSAVICNLPNGYGAGTTELHILRDYTKMLYMPYFLLLCKTHAFIQDGMKNFTGTAGQQRVGKDFISNYLVPLPPVEEQKRIVQRANFVIESCDIL